MHCVVNERIRKATICGFSLLLTGCKPYLYPMKKIVLLALAIIFIHIGAHAQSAPGDQSLLWRISGNGMTKPSYLFGTIHLICPEDYLWTDKMKQSLALSEKVCFEMDLDDTKLMMSASDGFIATDGKKLKDYYTPEQYQLLKKFVKDSIGMDIGMLQQMKPIALESIISMKTTKCLNPVSYEETIMKAAKEAGKEVLGLEDPSEQIGALDSMPSDSVAKEVFEEIRDFAKNKQEYNAMVTAYKTQQLSVLYEKITSVKGQGDDMRVLLDDRNKRWIARMTAKINKSSVFFAVGAGHLPGSTGVISLLRNAGYTVEPVF